MFTVHDMFGLFQHVASSTVGQAKKFLFNVYSKNDFSKFCVRKASNFYI